MSENPNSDPCNTPITIIPPPRQRDSREDPKPPQRRPRTPSASSPPLPGGAWPGWRAHGRRFPCRPWRPLPDATPGGGFGFVQHGGFVQQERRVRGELDIDQTIDGNTTAKIYAHYHFHHQRCVCKITDICIKKAAAERTTEQTELVNNMLSPRRWPPLAPTDQRGAHELR